MGTYANFYNSDNGDRVYDADSFSEWLRPFFKTGVFNGELQVLASSGMEVIVDTGNAFIEGKLKKFDSQTTLTVEQASANSTRIDAVVCRRNDTNRDFTLMVVKGSTVAPLPVRENGIYDIVLAHITVPASAVEIKQENITDTRMNGELCGWVVSNVEEVDFDQVTTQWADYIANFKVNELQAFNEWFDTIKGQLSTDQAGSLQLQIDEQANKIATNTANISANKADIDANSADITSLQQTTSKNTSDIATNKANIATNTSNITSLENRLYKENDGENTINTDGGLIRGIKLYGRSLQDGTPTPENPIEIKSVVNPKLTVCGKNLWSLGTLNNSSGNKLKIYIPKGIYTISRKEVSNDIAFRFFTAQSMAVENSFTFSLASDVASKKLIISSDIYGINYNIASDFIVEKEMQIELGSTATEYEPYQGNQATLPYTLNAIPVTSGGNVTIDGQQYIADYVDIDKKQLVRNVGLVDLGIFDYIYDTSSTNKRFFVQPNKSYNIKHVTSNNEIANIICTHLTPNSEHATTHVSSSYDNCISVDKSNLPYIIIRCDSYKDSSTFKNTMSGAILYYELATPTIINLTDEEVQDFKSLHTYEGVTNIIDSSDQISGSHKFIYNIADVIDNQCANIDKLKQHETVTLGTAWTQDSTNGYYTQTVALSGITSNDNPPIDVVLSGTLAEMQAQQEEWGKILKIETSTDALTFYASEATTVGLSVMVKGV